MKREKQRQLYKITPPQNTVLLGETFSVDNYLKHSGSALTVYMLFSPEEKNEYIEKAFNTLLKNTDALRLRIVRKGLHYMQYVEPFEFQPLEVVQLSGGYAAFQDILANIEQYKVTRKSSPLYMAKLYVYDGGKAFLLRAHHSICDGYSLGLILKRFENAYLAHAAGKEPDEKTGSVIDYFKQQEAYLASDARKEDRKYWAKQFLSQKQYQFPVGRRSSHTECAVKYMTIEREQFEKLKKICFANGYSLTTAEIAVASLAFFLFTGKRNFGFYTLSHGRDTYQLKKSWAA